jgi:hypothetical protein
MDKYEELAALIIDDVSEVAEAQHPEIKLSNKITREIGLDKGTEALICGEQYYSLEDNIAEQIRKFVRKIKSKKAKVKKK